MPGADGSEKQPNEAHPTGEEPGEQQIHHWEAHTGQNGLWQADGQLRKAQQGHKGHGQIAFQYVHAAAPGDEVAGIGVPPGVHPVGEHGVGLISGVGLVLVEPAGHPAQLPQPHRHPNQNEKQGQQPSPLCPFFQSYAHWLQLPQCLAW